MEASEHSLASTDATSTLANSVHRLRRRSRANATPQNIFLFLLAYRIVNALSVHTFFQPDEFFQSLEPAWQVVFGQDSGAWITWEWKHELRSSVHPLFFAAVYYIAGSISWIARLSSLNAADLLIASPKIAQAAIAAAGDYYTWKLAGKVYGSDSYGAWATLALTALSPWQWFCSTRTFSNCAETTLTITALYNWPWEWFLDIKNTEGEEKDGAEDRDSEDDAFGSTSQSTRYRWPGLDGDIFTIMFLTVALSSLRKSLLLAALACVLRPTNVIIWASIACFAMFKSPRSTIMVLMREAAVCGSAVLGVSIVIDRLYYGIWTFPVFKFLYVNVVQSIANFYGQNDWHYYLSQGYPLLLTTALPFTIFGLYTALHPGDARRSGNRERSIKYQLATVCLVMPAVLSVIAHKEVRFIYPLLPALHILSAEPLVSFFLPAISSSSSSDYLPRRLILLFLVLVNIFVAYYTTLIHASGPEEVFTYLRERHDMHQNGFGASLAPHPLYGGGKDPQRATSPTPKNMSVGFLMPCHSTPWRSHFVFPSIEAWALSCDPPIGLNETQKRAYLDEADQFYSNPSDFLQTHMVGGLWHVPRRPSYMSNPAPRSPSTASHAHQWPDYLVFFAQLEPSIRTILQGSAYAECKRTWNTAWHDDWRRQGDIVVWCLDPKEQRDWQKIQHKKRQERREQQLERVISRFEQRQKKQNHSWMSSLPWPFSSFSSSSSSSSSNAIRLSSRKSSPIFPSWLTDRNIFGTRTRYKYIPNFVQDHFPSFLSSSSSSFFPSKLNWFDPRSWIPSSSSLSSWWSSRWSQWNNKKTSKKKSSVTSNERDLWQ